MSDSNSSSFSPATAPFISCSKFPTPKTLSVSNMMTKAALLLPLSLTVLYFAFRRRRPSLRQSHADFFACHLALLELLGVLGSVLHVCGVYADVKRLETAGVLLVGVTEPGEVLILSVTCVDRYLAVVRPVAYLQLKGGSGAIVRNVSAALVWIVAAAFIGLLRLHSPDPPVVEFVSLLVSSVAVVSFCSAAVLRVLVRPPPGDARGDRAGAAKRRAFRIIVTILCLQLLWLLGFLICIPIFKSSMDERTKCLLITTLAWLNLPGSLVSPVLFLQTKTCG